MNNLIIINFHNELSNDIQPSVSANLHQLISIHDIHSEHSENGIYVGKTLVIGSEGF